MSGLFSSIKIEGNRITEFSQAAAQVGNPIPYGWGRCLVEGNCIFAKMPPKEKKKKQKQGKGGGVTTTEYTYSLSYAIGFFKGPIYGYYQIRRNGRVVFDLSKVPPMPPEDASAGDKIAWRNAVIAKYKWFKKATFYYGTESQMPNATITSYKGVGNVSAHRGLAYIVLTDEDVTAESGAVPTYQAVVMASPPELYFTSRLYNYDMEVEGFLTDSFGLRRMELKKLLLDQPPEAVSTTASIQSISLRQIYKSYDAPVESVQLTSNLQSISQRTILLRYENYAVESVELVATLQSVSMKVLLIVYPYETESIQLTSNLQSISLGP